MILLRKIDQKQRLSTKDSTDDYLLLLIMDGDVMAWAHLSPHNIICKDALDVMEKSSEFLSSSSGGKRMEDLRVAGVRAVADLKFESELEAGNRKNQSTGSWSQSTGADGRA